MNCPGLFINAVFLSLNPMGEIRVHILQKKGRWKVDKNLEHFVLKIGLSSRHILTTCKKTFFRVSKFVKPCHFFFYNIDSLAKILFKKTQLWLLKSSKNIFCTKKLSLFPNLQYYIRFYLLRLKPSNVFCLVSLLLPWNQNNCHSFTETLAQKNDVLSWNQVIRAVPNFQKPVETSSNFPETSFKFPETSSNFPETSFNFPETSFNFPETSFNLPETNSNSPETSFKFPVTSSNFPKNSFNFPESSSSFARKPVYIPGNMFQFPGIQFHFPRNQFQISKNQFQFPGNQFQISGNQFQFSWNQFQFLGNQLQFPGNQFKFPGNQYKFPGKQFQFSGN